VRAGRAEGRSPRNSLGFRYQIISRLAPLDERMSRAAAANAEVAEGGPDVLLAGIDSSRGGGLHITFSHDSYVDNVGGVQLCLKREAAAIAGQGRDHLHLYPAEPWPMLRVGETSLLGVVWNGQAVGAFAPAIVAQAVSNLAPGGRSFAIHSLLGHAVDEVVAVLAAAKVKAGFFWLHDFASLCAGYHLTRNDVADCGAPPPASGACGVCVYGGHRARHLEEHARLFAALDLTVVSPSESALATWKQAWTYPAKDEVVAPHAALVAPRAFEADEDEGEDAGPLRVGFLGWASPLKGWPVFAELAIKYEGDPRYSFHHIASQTMGGLPIVFEKTVQSAETPDAVRQAVEAVGLDVAVVWPICRETFSFTAYEAFAGGAAVLTSPDSGNVAAFVGERDAGMVLADERALDALFETGDILALARKARRPTLYDLAYGEMSAGLIGDDRP
jgi:hypothetical protein